jgi:hypothetical protein
MFLRVGVTKYCKLQGKLLAGSRQRSAAPGKAPWYNTVRTPTDKSVWGIYIMIYYVFQSEHDREQQNHDGSHNAAEPGVMKTFVWKQWTNFQSTQKNRRNHRWTNYSRPVRTARLHSREFKHEQSEHQHLQYKNVSNTWVRVLMNILAYMYA